jgi:hypothetical protein
MGVWVYGCIKLTVTWGRYREGREEESGRKREGRKRWVREGGKEGGREGERDRERTSGTKKECVCGAFSVEPLTIWVVGNRVG